MALNTTQTTGLSLEMKTYYDRTLLERTLPVLLHDRWGQKRNIPLHNGKVVEYRKFDSLPVSLVPLTEGVPPTLKDISVTAITATLDQYGDAVGFTDVVSLVSFDPILTETAQLLGEQAGEVIDALICNVLNVGTTVYWAGVSSTSRATVGATDIFTIAELRKLVRTLKVNRAKTIGGYYQAIIHPRMFYDIQGTTEWVTANQFAQTGRQFDGSLGALYGVKFWETDKAKIFTGTASGNVGGGESDIDVYSMLVFGANAYGSINLDGQSLKTIYKALGSAGTADPLDQQQSMGWKVFLGTKILNEAFMIRYEAAVSA